MGPSSSTSPDWSRLVVSPSQAPTDRDLRKFSGSSTPAGAGDELPSKLCRAQAHGPPRFKERKQDRGKSLLISQERADMGFETAALAGRRHEPECLHQPADLVGEFGRDLHQPVPRRPQCASEHAVEALDPHLTTERLRVEASPQSCYSCGGIANRPHSSKAPRPAWS